MTLSNLLELLNDTRFVPVQYEYTNSALYSLQCLLIYYFAVYVYQESVVSIEQRWAEYLGWLASISPIIFGVILGAAHAVWKETGSLKGVTRDSNTLFLIGLT